MKRLCDFETPGVRFWYNPYRKDYLVSATNKKGVCSDTFE